MEPNETSYQNSQEAYLVDTFTGQKVMKKKRDRSLSSASDPASVPSLDDDHNEDRLETTSTDKNISKLQRRGSIIKVHSSPNLASIVKKHELQDLTIESLVSKGLQHNLDCEDLQTQEGKPIVVIKENTQRVTSIGKVSSMPSLSSLLPQDNLGDSKELQIGSFVNTNPAEFMKTIIISHGYDPKVIPVLSIENFFKPITIDQIAAYDNVITDAVRSQNLDLLRDLQRSGRHMECCNRFGESIMHMACRRGSTSVVTFLLDECSSSIRLRDDFGRTPLHDACWTADVQFDIVKMLLLKEPDLLLLSDKRGHTPLDYAARDSWGPWCEFLNENRYLLFPKTLFRRK